MKEEDFQKLQNLASSFRRLNGKIKLISLLDRAKKAYEENNYKDCIKSCNEILKTNPKNPIALRGLGCVMQSKGNLEEAIAYYKKALETSEHKEIEYTLLGTVYYNLNNFETAIEYYNQAIDCNDDYEKAYEGRNQSMLEHHLNILDLQDNLIKRNLF